MLINRNSTRSTTSGARRDSRFEDGGEAWEKVELYGIYMREEEMCLCNRGVLLWCEIRYLLKAFSFVSDLTITLLFPRWYCLGRNVGSLGRWRGGEASLEDRLRLYWKVRRCCGPGGRYDCSVREISGRKMGKKLSALLSTAPDRIGGSAGAVVRERRWILENLIMGMRVGVRTKVLACDLFNANASSTRPLWESSGLTDTGD